MICAGVIFVAIIAFLDRFVAIFFIENHDVRNRPDNQPLWLSPASSGTTCRLAGFTLCFTALSLCLFNLFPPLCLPRHSSPRLGNCIPRGKLCAGGKAPTWRALLHVSFPTDSWPRGARWLVASAPSTDRRRDRHRGDHRDRSRARHRCPGDGNLATRQTRRAAASLRSRQYASEQFQKLMSDHGVVCSMSRLAMSGTMRRWRASSSAKTERTSHKTYRTRDQAKADVFDYIECFYNPKRRHSTIGYLSPVEFEMQAGLA